MKILISNDDGIHAPGIHALAKALEQIADITVIAPDRNHSGASHSLTLDKPVRLKTLENGFISVEGTPTDCVHLAITGLLDEQPDMVVSGINAGANLGDDVLYSGTVAAATEGRFLGLPAMAVSLIGEDGHHYDTAARVACDVIKRLQVNAITNDKTILNINVPDIPYDQLQGIDVTRLGARHVAEPFVKQIDPRGRPHYWIGTSGPEQDAGPGTDFYAINQNKVSISPVQMDLTHYKQLEPLTEWLAHENILAPV